MLRSKVQVLKDENKVLSVIWLGMANKYLDKTEDEKFAKEFDIIWQFWKTGKII